MGPFCLEPLRTMALSVPAKVLPGLFRLRVGRNGLTNFRLPPLFPRVSLAVAAASLRNLPPVVNLPLPPTGARTGWVMAFMDSRAMAPWDGHLISARTSIPFAAPLIAQVTRFL